VPEHKNTPLPPSEVIPFGKYRGQPAEVLLQDPKYAEWLQGQDWFRQHYQSLNIFISNLGQPADTPEHNAIQVMFLDPGFRLKFAMAVAGAGILETADSSMVNERVDAILADAGSVGKKLVFPKDGDPILRTSEPVFERAGVDVSFDFRAGVAVYIDNGPYTEPNYYMFGNVRSFSVEIKPLLGDDFPGVLRQMRSLFERSYGHDERALLYSSYHGTGATEEQVVKVFASAGFRMVRLDAVESVFVPPFDTTFERISA